MSITFCLTADSQFPLQPYPRHDDPDYHEKGMAVYEANEAVHAQRAEIEGEFNVSNHNGRYIVTELLGEEFDYCGSIDANAAALRLAAALATGADEQGVEAPSESRGVMLTAQGVGLGATVIDCGRSEAQVSGYVNALSHLISVAQERGCEICWA